MALTFLGWHFQVQISGKFRGVPSEDATKHSIPGKLIVNCSNDGRATAKAIKLALWSEDGETITVTVVGRFPVTHYGEWNTARGRFGLNHIR